jgi:hypothetical protein
VTSAVWKAPTQAAEQVERFGEMGKDDDYQEPGTEQLYESPYGALPCE